MTLKSWKTIPGPLKVIQKLIINPLGCSLAPGSGKTCIRKKNVKKYEKNVSFVKKLSTFVMLKCWNHSITTRNNAVTYYQTLKEVPWHLSVKQKFALKKTHTFTIIASHSRAIKHRKLQLSNGNFKEVYLRLIWFNFPLSAIYSHKKPPLIPITQNEN